jgi:hypothetical protein
MVHGSEQAAAATAGYSALVRGPSPAFPRGGVWMFSVWYAGMYLCLLLVAGFSLWYNLVVLAAFSAAAAFMTRSVTKASHRAFAADHGGIWLGKNTAGARRVRLEWQQVRQLSISSHPHGSVLQILVNSGIPATGRRERIVNLALVLLPLGIRRARPELLTVLLDPPRYRVPLAKVTPDELRSALSGLAPATLAIEMLPWDSARMSGPS